MMSQAGRLVKRVKSADIGVFFDLDGTLFDTLDFHAETFFRALRALGYPADERIREEFRQLIGLRFVDILRRIMDVTEEEARRIGKKKWELSLNYIHLVRPLPWALWTLKELERLNIPYIVVSSSSRTFVGALLKRYGIDAPYIGAEDVKRGKPDPEPFLRARNVLGVGGIAVGDTQFDALSARGAGLKFMHAYLIRRVPEVCSMLLGTRR